jgi:hypothetical protein
MVPSVEVLSSPGFLDWPSGKWPRYFETAEHDKKFIQPGEWIKPSPETSEPKPLCNISGFCLIPQSFIETLVARVCPPSQISASAYTPRLMSEPERNRLLCG